LYAILGTRKAIPKSTLASWAQIASSSNKGKAKAIDISPIVSDDDFGHASDDGFDHASASPDFDLRLAESDPELDASTISEHLSDGDGDQSSSSMPRRSKRLCTKGKCSG